jgi:predicted N-formylglutamate amidohydrolase
MSWLVSCEHASRELPPEYGGLGLSAQQLASHIAWDPGAGEFAEDLARRIGAPCELGRFTRLLVDLNRSASNPDAVPAVAFGVPVPGNQRLSEEQRRRRLDTYHAPYWSTVHGHLRKRNRRHISVHSFTPELDPARRTYAVGLLFDPGSEPESALALRLAQALRARGYEAVFNEPYPGTMDLIATGMRRLVPGYVGVGLELNQALMTGAWQQPLLEAIERGLDD